MGKRTRNEDFTMHRRGGKGMKAYRVTAKTGRIVALKGVEDGHDIMLITSAGTVIRIKCSDISILGRDTSGVKLMNLEEGIRVASVARVPRQEEEEEESIP